VSSSFRRIPQRRLHEFLVDLVTANTDRRACASPSQTDINANSVTKRPRAGCDRRATQRFLVPSLAQRRLRSEQRRPYRNALTPPSSKTCSSAAHCASPNHIGAVITVLQTSFPRRSLACERLDENDCHSMMRLGSECSRLHARQLGCRSRLKGGPV
jgi:hypothetical protein